MSNKYQVLAHLSDHDTSLQAEEFDTIEEAVKDAIGMYGNDFAIVQIVSWKVVEL